MRVNREFLLSHMSEEQDLCSDEVNELATMDKNKFVERLELGRKQIVDGETILADEDYFDKKIAMIKKRCSE